MEMISTIKSRIQDSIDTKNIILKNEEFVLEISHVAELIYKCLSKKGKILVCGNGGSASDSLHMVGEIVGRFQRERKGWAAIALNSDVATMTAIANDYGYDCIFARQVEAYMKPGDVLIGISTSGNSENIYKAVKKVKELDGHSVLLTGKNGGKISKEADYSLIVPTNVTARIQESHIMIIHIICELVEEMMINE